MTKLEGYVLDVPRDEMDIDDHDVKKNGGVSEDEEDGEQDEEM